MTIGDNAAYWTEYVFVQGAPYSKLVVSDQLSVYSSDGVLLRRVNNDGTPIVLRCRGKRELGCLAVVLQLRLVPPMDSRRPRNGNRHEPRNDDLTQPLQRHPFTSPHGRPRQYGCLFTAGRGI